jgi:outer membrane protein W
MFAIINLKILFKMKKIILSLAALMTFAFATAQEEGKFRVGLDLGYTIPSGGGGGILISLEPKYNITDNMNIGLRFGSAAMVRNFSGSDIDGNLKANIASNGSYLATYDYYFKGSSSFVPYVGAGAGIYTLANVGFSSTDVSANEASLLKLDATSKFGGLIRAGFEWGKFRMGLEYNIVPKSNLVDFTGEKIGTAQNSYLGIHLGFYVGGGKWGK